MSDNAIQDRGCCFDNHRAELVGVYAPFEVWMNARTGQAEVFVRAEDIETVRETEIPGDVGALMEQYNQTGDGSSRRDRVMQVLGTIILVTWLALACTTTVLLATLYVLRMN